jgi:hypothetical protein
MQGVIERAKISFDLQIFRTEPLQFQLLGIEHESFGSHVLKFAAETSSRIG